MTLLISVQRHEACELWSKIIKSLVLNLLFFFLLFLNCRSNISVQLRLRVAYCVIEAAAAMFVLHNLLAVIECSPHVPFVWKTVGILIKVYIENNGKTKWLSLRDFVDLMLQRWLCSLQPRVLLEGP